jgi:hypothetical protein
MLNSNHLINLHLTKIQAKKTHLGNIVLSHRSAFSQLLPNLTLGPAQTKIVIACSDFLNICYSNIVNLETKKEKIVKKEGKRLKAIIRQ